MVGQWVEHSVCSMVHSKDEQKAGWWADLMAHWSVDQWADSMVDLLVGPSGN